MTSEQAKSSVQCNSSARSFLARMTSSRTNLKAFFSLRCCFSFVPDDARRSTSIVTTSWTVQSSLIIYLYLSRLCMEYIWLFPLPIDSTIFMLCMKMMMMPHESSYLPYSDRFSISNKIIPHFRAFFLATLKLLLNFILLRCPICGAHHRAAHKAQQRLHSLVINENWISSVGEEGDE